MKKIRIVFVMVTMILVGWSCVQTGDDESSKMNSPGDKQNIDFGSDDDADNAIDDDTIADDDDNDVLPDDDTVQSGEHPPILSNGIWDPNPAAYDQQYNITWSAIYFNICDLGDDLSGGVLYPYCANCQRVNFWIDDTMYLDDIASRLGVSLSPANDCNNPVLLAVGFNFSDLPADNYCMDLQAADADGYISDKLTDICLIVE